MPDGPLVFDSSSRAAGARAIPGPKFKVVPTRGLSRPYALVFLPDGSLLITERAGRLRSVRNGVLDPQPIAGIPPVLNVGSKGLNELNQRIREVRQGPDGLLYLLTDEEAGALLRLEPVPATQ